MTYLSKSPHISVSLFFFLFLLIGITNLLQGGTNGRAVAYPEWFVNQPADCGMTAVGLFQHSSLYPENSKKIARKKSIQAYLRQKREKHEGGQAFTITERGAVWLGDDIITTYDSTLQDNLLEELPLLDYQVAEGMVMVLSGVEACQEKATDRSHLISLSSPPRWISQLPSDTEYHYAVGTAPSYYYTFSSWEEAENTARRNLSASLHSTARGIQSYEKGQSFDVIHSDLSIVLHNAIVSERYFDQHTRLYYVLVRMPKN